MASRAQGQRALGVPAKAAESLAKGATRGTRWAALTRREIRRWKSRGLATEITKTPMKVPMDVFVHAAPGGMDGIFAILRSTRQVTLQRVVERWDDLTLEARESQTLETIAEDCHVTVGDIMGEYVRLGIDQGLDVSRVMQGLSLPELMAASIATASTPGSEGYHERRMHFEQVGLVQPRSAGRGTTQVAVGVNLGRGVRVSPTEPGLTGLPAVVVDQRELAERVRTQTADIVDAEATETQATMAEDEDDADDV